MPEGVVIRNMGKQPVAWKKYSEEYWLKELKYSMDMCTGRRDIAGILLKTALSTIQSIQWSRRDVCTNHALQYSKSDQTIFQI